MDKRLARLYSFIPGVFFVFIFIGLILRAIRLRNYLFYDWDEAIYAQVARELTQHPLGGMTFNGQPWLEKPPLLQYILAGIFSIFGTDTFWPRLLMALCAMGVLVLVYFLTKKIIASQITKESRIFDIHFAPLVTVLAVASTPMFINRATLINQDVFLASAWLGYFLFLNRYPLKATFFAIGVLTKSLLGFYPLVLEALFSWKTLFSKKNLLRTIMLIAIPSTWYVISYLKYGNYFIETHFLEHLLKRLTDPIELHFGGRMYYAELFWENFKYLTVPIVLGYGVGLWQIVKLILKYKLELLRKKEFFSYIILFSAIPFFAFLTFEKSKISWYLYPILPLSTLVLGYLYVKLPQLLKYILVVGVLIFFMINFIPQTYGYKEKLSPSEKQAMALCIKKAPTNKLAYLVEEDERKIRNVLEAAHLAIGSSFIYGGAPSFVFYSQKKVDFYYDPAAFKNALFRYNTVVMTTSDLTSDKSLLSALTEKYQVSCAGSQWIGLIKK